MKNITVAIKRLLSNKNTVTILGVILGIIVLYVGYNWRIKSATDPYPVPYAIKTLQPGTKITSDNVGTMNVPRAMLKNTVITNASLVVGKYVSADTIIPKGSLFYKRAVVEKEQLPGVSSLEYPQGYVLVNLEVDNYSSYGKLMYPGNYIDIYLKAVNKIDEENITDDTQDKIMVGKLIENVKILAVLDANGDNVFADIENKGTPAMVIFAVPEEYHILVRKAMYLRTYEATLIPVPTNASSPDGTDLEATLSSEELKAFINKITIWSDIDMGNGENLTIPLE